jgi:hypothetical protein
MVLFGSFLFLATPPLLAVLACTPGSDPMMLPPRPPGPADLEYEGVRAGLPTARDGTPPEPDAPPDHFEVLPGTVPTWAPLFQDCQTVASMPSGRTELGSAADPDTRELVTIGDFIREVTYDVYYWRNSDGAQVKFYQDVDHPNDVYVSIAGSSPNFGPDLNSLTENLASQSNAFPRTGYVEFVRQAVRDGIARILPPSSEPYRLFLTGHSQGGNVSQIVAIGMLDPEPANGFLERFQWSDGPEWVAVRQTMADRRVELAGVIPVASRPAGPMIKYNLELDGRDVFALFVQSSDDNVPLLASPSATLIPQSHPFQQVWDSVDALTNAIAGFAGFGFSWAWQKILGDRANGLWEQIQDALGSPRIVTTRSQIVFSGNGSRHGTGLVRQVFDPHGQHYLDPRVGLGTGAYAGPVPFDDFLQLVAPESPDDEASEITIPVLANDWQPLSTGADLRVVEARVIPRCRVLERDPGCPECVPIDLPATPEQEALCQGVVTVDPSGTTITYRSPTIGIAENARVYPLEPVINGSGYFASPELAEGTSAAQPLDPLRLLFVEGSYAELLYVVEDGSGRRADAYVRVHLVPPSPDGNPVTGPWDGGPFQAPRPFELPGANVTWDEREVYPAQAPLSHYLPARRPDQRPLRTPLRLRWLGGYGYDCRAAYVHDEPEWIVEFGTNPADPTGLDPLDICTGLRPDGTLHSSAPGPIAGPRLFSAPPVESLRFFPDDIPDTYWVDGTTRHDGSARALDYVAREQAVRDWTLRGANERCAQDPDPGCEPLADGTVSYFLEPGRLPTEPQGNVLLNRTYVSCPPNPLCSAGVSATPSFVGTTCPAAGGDVDWAAMRAEVASVNDPANLLLAVEIPYNPPADWPGFESGPCGSFEYELPVPCDGYQDYHAWNMGGAIATFRVRPGLPSIFNNWVSNAGYFAEGMQDPFYMHPAKTVDLVGCMGGNASFMGCSFGSFGDGLDDTALPVCNLARGSTEPGPAQPGAGAYGGRIRAFPVYGRSVPDTRFPVGWQECFDRISLAAQGGGTAVACQASDGLEHGSIFVAFQAVCPEEDGT